VDAFNQRQGFLVSAIVHLTLLMILVSRPGTGPEPPAGEEPEPVAPEERRQAVFLPPPEVLRQLAPRVATPRPTPPPPVAPQQTRSKDRISIGAPSAERSKGPLVLRREDDLTAVPKGKPSVAPPDPGTAEDVARDEAAGALERSGAEGLQLPPGLGAQPRGTEGSRARPAPPGGSIASSLRNLDRRLQDVEALGLPSGTGKQMGPLFFDPQGADFTLWIQHFKNEVYRNWIVPQPALLGMRGHVDLEFTIERDGSMTNLRLLKSAGNSALDRAARNALLGSRFLALPDDFGPPRVTMQVSFFYNEAPQGS